MRIKKPASFAFSQEIIDLIGSLSNELSLSKSQVLELALYELKKRGIKKEQLSIRTIIEIDDK